jgi:hypothetical protein
VEGKLMVDTRHRMIPKEVGQIYEDVARAAGIDPAAPVQEAPLTAEEMAAAAKQQAKRKGKRQAQRQARKRTRGSRR